MSIEASIAKQLMDFELLYGKKEAMKRCRQWHQWYRTEEAKRVIRQAARLAFGRS